jgi:hypothetical protein
MAVFQVRILPLGVTLQTGYENNRNDEKNKNIESYK